MIKGYTNIICATQKLWGRACPDCLLVLLNTSAHDSEEKAYPCLADTQMIVHRLYAKLYDLPRPELCFLAKIAYIVGVLVANYDVEWGREHATGCFA